MFSHLQVSFQFESCSLIFPPLLTSMALMGIPSHKAEAPDHPSRIATKKVSRRTGQALGIDLSSRDREHFSKMALSSLKFIGHDSYVLHYLIALFFAFCSLPLEWLGIAMENRNLGRELLRLFEDLRFATSRAVSGRLGPSRTGYLSVPGATCSKKRSVC